MEMTGEQLIPASQQDTWAALNDPEVLKACVPGCESITRVNDNEYQVQMTTRVGPVSAKFRGRLSLFDIKPPQSYSLAFEGQGGAAGFAKGAAQVKLSPEGSKTRLAYDVKANVGGKLAQIGSRLIDAAAKKVADEFFQNFTKRMTSSEDTTVGDARRGRARRRRRRRSRHALGLEHHPHLLRRGRAGGGDRRPGGLHFG